MDYSSVKNITMSECAVRERAPQVQEALAEIGKAQEATWHLVDALADRLNRALRPSPDAVEGKALAVQGEPTAPLAAEMMDMAERARGINKRLDYLLNHLEL